MHKTITRDELRRKLQESPGRTILIDVRDRQDYEVEHIKGAISVPFGELAMRALKDFGKDDEIIVYCGGFECTAGADAARMLDGEGFMNVLDYEGGLRDWKTAGFLTSGTGKVRAA